MTGRAHRRRSPRLIAWAAALLWAVTPAAAEIVDRIVAVVGREAITASEVDLQLRLEALLNREPLDLSEQRREQALNRLIERKLISQEMVMAAVFRSGEASVLREVERLRQSRFYSGLGFEKALQAYEVSEEQFVQFLRDYLSLEQFVAFRFKTGLEILPEQVERYYEQEFAPRFREAEGGEPPLLDKVRRQIRERLADRRANELLEAWLKEARASARILVLRPASSLFERNDDAEAESPPTP